MCDQRREGHYLGTKLIQLIRLVKETALRTDHNMHFVHVVIHNAKVWSQTEPIKRNPYSRPAPHVSTMSQISNEAVFHSLFEQYLTKKTNSHASKHFVGLRVKKLLDRLAKSAAYLLEKMHVNLDICRSYA